MPYWKPWEDLAQVHGFEIELLPVDEVGRVQSTDLTQALAEPAALVSIMLANNEIGTVQSIARLGAICQAQDTPLHTDAVQAMCKVPIRVDDLGRGRLECQRPPSFMDPKGWGFCTCAKAPLFCPARREVATKADDVPAPRMCRSFTA